VVTTIFAFTGAVVALGFIGNLFFVHLGFIATVSEYRLLIAGSVMAVLLLAGRWVASWLTAFRDQELRRNVGVLTLMLPRGLAAAVMGQLVTNSGFPHGDMLVSIVTVTIIGTVAIGALGTLYLARNRSSDALEQLMGVDSKVSA